MKSICPNCDGTGREGAGKHPTFLCSRCGGSGYRIVVRYHLEPHDIPSSESTRRAEAESLDRLDAMRRFL